MEKIKLMTVVGTRPEIIRLSSTIKLLDKQEAVEHILVHTGQNYDYELNQIFFEDLELRSPDYFLEAAKKTAVKTIGTSMIHIEDVINKEKPEAFLVLGDTNSALTAIVAKKHKIPIFHMEAGNRCFDESVPEETNRKIVDHIADINLPYSSIAREYLLAEGIPADRVIKTGSPMYEVIQDNFSKIKKSSIIRELKLKENNFFLVSSHREENVDNEKKLSEFIESLNAIVSKYKIPIIFSTHPRTLNRIKDLAVPMHENIQIHKPFSFTDYCSLQMNAKAVLSDSGTISEETSILGLKSLNIRKSHERPEAMEEGSVMLVGYSKNRILQGLSILDTSPRKREVRDYIFPNFSYTVLNAIISYTDYVHQNRQDIQI